MQSRMIVTRQFNRLRWSAIRKFERLVLAWRFVVGRLSKEQAYTLAYEVMRLTEEYPLTTIAASDVLDDFRETYKDHPQAPDWASEAAHRVWTKWESTGDERSVALEWAMDLVREYARTDGQNLEELNE